MPTILAAVMPKPHADVELREIPQPDLETDSALLAVELSEVCGTDVHLRHGRLAGVPYPLVPGHVSVGRLEKIRGRMLDINGRPFAEGDRVTFLDVHRTCHRCWHCLVAKASTRCPQRKVYGITYGLDDGPTGGWAEKVYLKPGTLCLRLNGVSTDTFMAGGCSLPTALHAVERGSLRFGDTVLVLGAGPVGLAAVAFATLAGAGRVLCIGAPRGRLEFARAVGAADVLDFSTCDESARRQWVLDQTDGRGADLTIEATGAPEAVTQAIRWTRDAGCVVVVGQYTNAGEISLNPHLDVNQKHLDIRGCWGSDFSHFYRGVEMLKTPLGQALWSKIGLERYELSRINEALSDVAEGRCVKALVVPKR
ncbi:MAG: zinc-binding dehydrogenase [bacterium]|nr:zinc-binding dehydrogenase [bacterium]